MLERPSTIERKGMNAKRASDLLQQAMAVVWVMAIIVALSGWPILGAALGMAAVVVVATTTSQEHPQYRFTVGVLTVFLLWAMYDGTVRRRNADERDAYHAYRVTIGCADYDQNGKAVRSKGGQAASRSKCADPDSVLLMKFLEAMRGNHEAEDK